MNRAALLLALALTPSVGYGQSSVRDTVMAEVGRRVAASPARTATALVGRMDSCSALVAPAALCEGIGFSDRGRTEVAYTATQLAAALQLAPTPNHAARARELRTAHLADGVVAGRSCNGHPGAVTVILPGPLTEIESAQRWRIAVSVLYVSSSDVACQAQGVIFEYGATREPETGRILVTGPQELLVGHGVRR